MVNGVNYKMMNLEDKNIISLEQFLATSSLWEGLGGLCFDSRKVTKNDVFIAINGVSVNGHQFIEKAISLGAKVVVCEEVPNEKHEGITYVQVENTKSALAKLSAFIISTFYKSRI